VAQLKKFPHRIWSKFSVIGIIIILLLAPVVGVSIRESSELEEGAFFSVEIDKEASDQEVVEGEDLTIVAEIENTGDEHDTKTIELYCVDYPDHPFDFENKPIREGDSVRVDLTWETELRDAGTYTLEVATEDDYDQIDVTVLKRDEFSVNINETESDQNVVEGKDVNISTEIENRGSDDGDQRITLYDFNYPETILDSENVSLEAGDSDNITLTWETELNDAGNYILVVASEDQDDIIHVTILKQAFEITINSPESDGEFYENNEIVVNYTVTNVGDVEDTQTIEFYIGDELIETKENIKLASGETYTDEFTWTPEERGEYTLKITSEFKNYEEATLSIEVNPPEHEMVLGIWWPYLVLIASTIIVVTGGALYLKHSETEGPVIEEVFLINEKNSMLILHNTRRIKPSRDSDIIASMFETVQGYIEDSFQDDEDWTLNKLEFGDNNIVIERGEHIYLAVVYKGQLNEEKIQEIRGVIERIEDEFKEKLEEWHGDSKELRGIKDMTEDLFS